MVDRMNLAILTFLATLSVQAHRDERGQDTLEWVLMSGLVAAAIVGTLLIFTGALTTMAQGVRDCVDWDNATACTPGF
jgi:Flp pilus assembly pilin Flp